MAHFSQRRESGGSLNVMCTACGGSRVHDCFELFNQAHQITMGIHIILYYQFNAPPPFSAEKHSMAWLGTFSAIFKKKIESSFTVHDVYTFVQFTRRLFRFQMNSAPSRNPPYRALSDTFQSVRDLWSSWLGGRWWTTLTNSHSLSAQSCCMFLINVFHLSQWECWGMFGRWLGVNMKKTTLFTEFEHWLNLSEILFNVKLTLISSMSPSREKLRTLDTLRFSGFYPPPSLLCQHRNFAFLPLWLMTRETSFCTVWFMALIWVRKLEAAWD